jgi:hypothetical protein
MRPLRPSTPLSYLLRQPATHRISSNSAYVTWCGRGYAPHHKPIRGTTDPRQGHVRQLPSKPAEQAGAQERHPKELTNVQWFNHQVHAAGSRDEGRA